MSDTSSDDSPTSQRQPPRPDARTLRARKAAVKRERQRASEEATRAGVGRTVARFNRMYGNTKIALMQALESSESDKEERRRNPSAPNPCAADKELLYYLIDHCPSLPSMIDDALKMRNPVKELSKMASDIDGGWSEARNTDTASLKKGLATNFNLNQDYDEFGHWAPPLNPTTKNAWGPHHPQLLPLVAPVRVPPLDNEELEKLKQPGAILSHVHWYVWMWKGRKHNPQDLDKGFLQGDLLVEAFLWLYFGSVTSPVACRATAARKAGFASITVHSIAYMATLLRYALSSETRIDQAFHSAGFYQHLVQYLEHEDQCQVTSNLLKWWNSNVFPAGVAEDADPEPDTNRTWELMIRHRAQRKAAAVAAAQQRQEEGNATMATTTTQSLTPDPITPPNDTTNTSRLDVSAQNGTTPSTPGSGHSLSQGEDEDEDEDDADRIPERPAKKARRPFPRRIEDSGSESDIDGEEVREDADPVVPVSGKKKHRPSGQGKKKAVGTAAQPRRSSRGSKNNGTV